MLLSPPLDYESAARLLVRSPRQTTTTESSPVTADTARNGRPIHAWRRYLEPHEWELVWQVFLRGPIAWTTFLRSTTTSSAPPTALNTPQTAAAPTPGRTTRRRAGSGRTSPTTTAKPSPPSPTPLVWSAEEFFQSLLTAGDEASDTVGTESLPSTFTPFVMACSWKIRAMLLDLYFLQYQPESTESAAADDLHLDDVYYTLEQDLECYQAWNSLQPDLNVVTGENDKPIVWNIENIPGLGKLKHLLQKIEVQAKRLNGKVSLSRIQELLQEINPKPVVSSKWANDDRVGQAELYEHLHRILEDLKNYKEHSFPFLMKVNRRDAPDYYDIIKKPMDLGQMTRTLQSQKYDSKQQFADDLQLIWSNCFYYNSDPASVYRVHAEKMQERAQQLLKYVPNIVIKTRAQFEAEGGTSVSVEEESDSETAVGEEGEDGAMSEDGNTSQDVTPELGADRHRLQSPSLQGASRPDADGQDASEEGSSNATLAVPLDASKLTIPVTFFPASYGNEPKERKSLQDEEEIPHPSSDAPVPSDPLAKIWELKGEWISQRMSQPSISFAQQPAIVRTATDMADFHFMQNLYFARRNLVTRKSNSVPPSPASATDKQDVAAIEPSEEDVYFFPEFCHVAGSFPSLVDHVTIKRQALGIVESGTFTNHMHTQLTDAFLRDVPIEPRQYLDGSLKSAERPSMQEYKSALISEPSIRRIKGNIESFRECKRLEKKLLDVLQNSLRSDTSPAAVSIDGEGEDSEAADIRIHYPKWEPRTRQLPRSPLILTDTSAQDLLKRSAALLLANAGFEGTSSHCLQIFTEIAADFLQDMGKLLHELLDNHSNTVSVQDLLEQTLSQSGVPNAAALEYSIHREPLVASQKLQNRKKRLEDYLDAVLHPEEDDAENDDADIDEDVAFVMGDFGTELGDDYLGLRSMDVDVMGNVPDKLWNLENRKSNIRKKKRKQRAKILRSYAANLVGEDLTEFQQFEPPAAFLPITDANTVIGLLRPFFEKKLAESGENGLVEDEFLPPKVASKKKKKKTSPRKERPVPVKRVSTLMGGTSSAEPSPKRNRKKVDLDALDGTYWISPSLMV